MFCKCFVDILLMLFDQVGLLNLFAKFMVIRPKLVRTVSEPLKRSKKSFKISEVRLFIFKQPFLDQNQPK